MKFTVIQSVASVIAGCLPAITLLCFQSPMNAPAENIDFSDATTLWQEDRFSGETLEFGLTRPMELDVASNGTIYFIELDGNLRRLLPGATKSEIIGTLKVFTAQESGLIGLALDPDFDSNRRLYLQYSPVEYSGQHISRFELNSDGALDMDSEEIILKFEEQRDECCHHAGSLEFGPEGNLFIATGDNTHPGGDSGGYAPIDEREGRHAYDAQDSAANTMDLRGKILRIRPLEDGGYSIPEGNLFPPGSQKGRPEIYVMGCRNPWRIQIDPATGFLYWGEVGPDAGGEGPRGPRGYDEVNQARAAGNFGWPFFVGANFAYADYDYETKAVGPLYDASRPENRSPTNTGARFLPPAQPAWIYYPYADSKEFPVLGSGGRTACAGPVFHFKNNLDSAVQFPKTMDRCLLFYDWQRTFFMVAELDENSDIQNITPFPTPIPLKRPIDMVFGPDGSLLVLDYGATWGVNEDAKLVKINYFSGNRPPIAKLDIQPSDGSAPLLVHFDASNSTDPDLDDQLTYLWQFTPDTDSDDLKEQAKGQVTFTEPGEYQALLTVSDSNGASDKAYARIVVGNTRPTLRIDTPAVTGNLMDFNQPLRININVEDQEDGSSELSVDFFQNRVFSRVVYQDAKYPDVPEAALNQGHLSGASAALALIQNSDCLNCHAIDKRVIGPGFNEIADRYKDDSEALNQAVARVIAGSTGVWGELPMLPHESLSQETVQTMVNWIFDRESREDKHSWKPGLSSLVDVRKVSGSSASEALNGILAVETRYTDLGAPSAPPLTGSSISLWRSNRIQAEDFNSKEGTQILSSDTAEGGKFIGDIQNGRYLVFNQIHWGNRTQFTVRVASPNAGGVIELREGNPQGQLLGQLEFEPTGDWQEWRENSVTLPHLEGEVPVTLCLVFKNPKSGNGGFMNLDSFRFEECSSR